MEGFNLLQYIKDELGMDRLKSFFTQIRDDFDVNAKDGGKIFKQFRYHLRETQIYDLDQIDKALHEFQRVKGESNILINCSPNL
jgi:hypothetical protein